jgi:hypothetical protein
MYYGHSSWIALVVFGAMFATRYFAGQRRGGRRGRSPSRSSFTAPGAPGAPGPVGTASTGTAAGWFRDPFHRHEQRFWSGTAWTEHVTDAGVPGNDPPPTPRRRDA